MGKRKIILIYEELPIKTKIKLMKKAMKKDHLTLFLNNGVDIKIIRDCKKIILKEGRHYRILEDDVILPLEKNNLIFRSAEISINHKMRICESIKYAKVVSKSGDYDFLIPIIWKAFVLGMSESRIHKIVYTYEKANTIINDISPLPLDLAILHEMMGPSQ